jgi:multidrug efflux pump
VKLSQISIERPVLATVMSLVVVLAGLIALSRLPNREYPDVDPPVRTKSSRRTARTVSCATRCTRATSCS